MKDIRTLDRTANITGKMKNAYIRTKEQSEQTQQFGSCSPSGYAEDHATESFQDIARVAGYELRRQRKQFAEKARYRIKEHCTQEDFPEQQSPGIKKEPLRAQHESASSNESQATKSIFTDYTERGRNFARSNVQGNTDNSARFAVPYIMSVWA